MAWVIYIVIGLAIVLILGNMENGLNVMLVLCLTLLFYFSLVIFFGSIQDSKEIGKKAFSKMGLYLGVGWGTFVISYSISKLIRLMPGFTHALKHFLG